MEEVKRADPTSATLRELYILSGNKCAFPGCSHEVINENGTLVAQLCHIEAAMPGGERFNPDSTNKERAQAENLLFLCYKHHTITNDVSQYPVERMRKIRKNDHENLFRNIMNDMLRTIEDNTKKQVMIESKSLKSINERLQWNLNESDLKDTLDIYNEIFNVLTKINKNTRVVFTTLLERSEKEWNREALISASQQSLNLTDNVMANHLDILTQNELISQPAQGDNYLGFTTNINEVEGLDVWGDIKNYCELEQISLEEVIVELNFDKLD